MSQEDLKALVDIAERRYINIINLNAPAPQISISGQNTGSTEADRVRLAAVLRDMILDMRGTTPAVPAAQ